MKLIPLNNECHFDCPSGYTHFNYETNNRNATDCFPCKENCPKHCYGDEIYYIDQTDHLRGCNIVNGNLFIKINNDMIDSLERLQRNLGDITEIKGVVRIYRYVFFF